MDLETCHLLAKYNQFANNGMNSILSKLDNRQWNQEFGGYFKSVKELCNHLYISDFYWLKRFGRLRNFQYISDPLFADKLAFGSIPLTELADYLVKREEMDKKIVRFTGELTQEDLAAKLSFTNSKGVSHSRNFGALVLHMFNHQTHHRGMVSVYLDIMKIDNDFSNLMMLA